jgi:S1-C subfamily serine protease
MFNMKGEVIGIVSHNISKGGGSEGLGFVVSINTAKQLLLERPSFWSGLDGRLISGPIARGRGPGHHHGRAARRGRGHHPEGPKVQGIPVGEASDHRRVRDILATVPPGGEFTMTVLRLGQVIELKGRHP